MAKKKRKKLEFKPAERRKQIREEMRDLAQEYLQTWDSRAEVVCTGYVMVTEFVMPEQEDADARGWCAIQPDSMSQFAAKGLAHHFLEKG